MENWRTCWRNGFAPNLSTPGLEALKRALLSNDQRLKQGITCWPPPLLSFQEVTVTACCPIAFAGWQGEGLQTTEEVANYFASKCFEADNLLGEPASCRWFLNWFDETERESALRELLEEVKLELIRRTES